MIVALGFPLNVAAIILGCIFSTLLSVFNALGPISNPTPPTAALTEFFHADTVASDQPQLERTFSSYVRIQAVVLKTYLGR